ncbi:MAG: response regulator [Bacteroidia bacterium]|nr:response regulator [Bacteroidia bacterium]
MASSPIRLLLVDDSGFMRLLTTSILSEDQELVVLDTAQDGQDALMKTHTLRPDVIVLDLLMQNYDGLYAVREIMTQVPTPIIIFSGVGNLNFEKVIEALEAGAYDFVHKPQGAYHSKVREVKNELIQKIKLAAQVDVAILLRKKVVNHYPHSFTAQSPYEIIVIGASTGGTTAIETILLKIPQNLPIPIVIAQHIPAEFGCSFARRLDEMLPLKVSVAQPDEILRGGHIYILASEVNTKLVRRANRVLFKPARSIFHTIIPR